MARHYATRDRSHGGFRQIPNPLLARYFHARGVFADLDIAALPEPQPDALWAVCLLFIHPPAHGSEVGPAARNTLDSARIPRVSKLLICGLFQKGRVLAQDGDNNRAKDSDRDPLAVPAANLRVFENTFVIANTSEGGPTPRRCLTCS